MADFEGDYLDNFANSVIAAFEQTKDFKDIEVFEKTMKVLIEMYAKKRVRYFKTYPEVRR